MTDGSGRLGKPGMTLAEDPRVDTRIKVALAAFEMNGEGDAPPVRGTDPKEALLGFCDALEPAFEGLFEALSASLEPIDDVEHDTLTLTGAEGHDIVVHVHRPKGVSHSIPGLLHVHGGGMAILSAAGPVYARWRDLIAATGVAVFGVEFRNSAGALGSYPFPAGLNDCYTALQHLAANKTELGLSKIAISGESGGGNLTIATAMKAKNDGTVDQIAGLYAMCPYISNAYRSLPSELPSLLENDTYFVRCDILDVLAALYDGPDSQNAMAWPLHATSEMLSGFPPTVISVNECDPLRDEGVAFHKTLVEAGVSSRLRQVSGTTHAADCIFQGALADNVQETVNDIKSFLDDV